jgi:Cyanophycin synthase-like N-terminal domain
MSQLLFPTADVESPNWELVQPPKQTYFVENLFSLSIVQKRTRTTIVMDVLHHYISTEEIPMITDVLQKNLPSILGSTCYNDLDLPFHEEVQQTELGHLFEHILLEYLCQYKIAKGARRATYTGRTTWNWVRDPFGRFHIYLTCGRKDADILPIALEQTVSLMKIILGYHHSLSSPVSTAPNGLKNGERRW